METTAGTLLNGRIHYRQPRDGYRTGIEPVLLAASVPAQAGQVVIEAGTGAGAGLLCLAARVPGVIGIGIEVDAAMAKLARENFQANDMDARLSVTTADVLEAALPLADHAMANPPWHDPGSSASPVRRRRLAKQEGEGVEAWVAAMARAVRGGGSLTMVLPPGLANRALAACADAGLGAAVRHELPPKAGRPAKLVLVQATRGGVAALREQATVLHEASGRFTRAVEAVLREGEAFPLA